MTSPERPTGTGSDQLAGGASGEHRVSGHGLLDGRGAASAEATPDACGDPAADFAAQLRELRDRAGRPSYRRLAQLAHYSHTALSQAAAGHCLPSLAVTQAFVRACGGDVEEWSARWREAGQAARSPGEPPCLPVPGPARAGSRWRAAAGGLCARGRIAAAAMAVAVCVTAAVLWTVGPAAVTGMPGRPRPLLQVESSGLYVWYVLVTNTGTRAGYAYVVNVGAGKVHHSRRPVPPGQSWPYFFDRALKEGTQICGSIGGGPATCVRVHA